MSNLLVVPSDDEIMDDLSPLVGDVESAILFDCDRIDARVERAESDARQGGLAKFLRDNS